MFFVFQKIQYKIYRYTICGLMWIKKQTDHGKHWKHFFWLELFLWKVAVFRQFLLPNPSSLLDCSNIQKWHHKTRTFRRMPYAHILTSWDKSKAYFSSLCKLEFTALKTCRVANLFVWVSLVWRDFWTKCQIFSVPKDNENHSYF